MYWIIWIVLRSFLSLRFAWGRATPCKRFPNFKTELRCCGSSFIVICQKLFPMKIGTISNRLTQDTFRNFKNNLEQFEHQRIIGKCWQTVIEFWSRKLSLESSNSIWNLPLAGSAPIPVSILTASTASTVSLLSLNNVERETARKTLAHKPRV